MRDLLNLAWIDLEMTGLDPQKDVILEIACLVTDKNLDIIAQSSSYVIHQDQEKLDDMNDFVKTMHTNSGLIEEVKISTLNIKQVQKDVLDFFSEFCFPSVTPLCGNSVWNDRRFLRKYMSELDSFFHYRIVDVSSVRELVKRWYPDNPSLVYNKAEIHRALPDIIASVQELKNYRENFFIK